MERLPPPPTGFVRIAVQLRGGVLPTPGELVSRTGLPADRIGHAAVLDGCALVDVHVEDGKVARAALEGLGMTRLADWEWRWLRLAVGRNHGLSIGQLRKIMLNADALPLGRIAINNTHTLVGIQDFKLPAVLERLGRLRINGFAPKPEALPSGKGPGSPAFQRP
jgi:hypothetical protein